MEVSEGECPAPFPGLFLFAHPNPEAGGEKGEKRELGPVDPLEGKGKDREAGTSIVQQMVMGKARLSHARPGQFSDRSGVERTKSSRSLVSRNDEETREKEIRRQVDSYRAIDRSGPVTGL